MVWPQLGDVDPQVRELRRRHAEEWQCSPRPETDADVCARFVCADHERTRHRSYGERDPWRLAAGRASRKHEIDGAVGNDLMLLVRLPSTVGATALPVFP